MATRKVRRFDNGGDAGGDGGDGGGGGDGNGNGPPGGGDVGEGDIGIDLGDYGYADPSDKGDSTNYGYADPDTVDTPYGYADPSTNAGAYSGYSGTGGVGKKGGSVSAKTNTIGKAKGGMVKKYAKGGTVSSASSRGDGIAQRGKTRGRMC